MVVDTPLGFRATTSGQYIPPDLNALSFSSHLHEFSLVLELSPHGYHISRLEIVERRLFKDKY